MTRHRNRARIKFLMADWGPEKFRQVLQDEYLDAPLPDGPAPAPAPKPPPKRPVRAVPSPPEDYDGERTPRKPVTFEVRIVDPNSLIIVVMRDRGRQDEF